MDELRLADASGENPNELYPASMGIYILDPQVFTSLLMGSDQDHFGKHIIPDAIDKVGVYAHTFDGYWEDIGTVRAFFEANLQLTDEVPSFDFYDEDYPIYNYPDILPTAKLNQCNVSRTTIASGCMVGRSSFERCMLGVRSFVGNNCKLKNVVMMGADYFSNAENERKGSENNGHENIGVGDRSVIENAIIDKNARIGSDVNLSPNGVEDGWFDDDLGIHVRDEILVVVKNAIVPSGTKIGA